MRTLGRLTFALALVAGACGGEAHQTKVEEVPIDQGGGTSDVPSDSTSGTAQTVIPTSDASAPPGVGPQSLDQPQTQDAGAASTQAAFVARPGGLSEKQCNDLVLRFAKLMTKEHKTPTPAAADLPKDPIYGQMMSDCGQSTTKKQQKCGMTARTTAGWKKCME